MNKFRKKGELFLEYIIVLPLMIISLWLILQLIVYVYANNEVQQAADSGSLLVAQEMRGTTSTLDLMSNKSQILDDLFTRLGQSIGNNGFILYSKDSNGNALTLSDYQQYIEGGSTGINNCSSALQDNSKKRVLCVYTSSITVGGRSHDQMIVRVKMPFLIIGDFIPGLQDNVFLYGTGSTTKDISGRFQYY